MMKTPPKTKKTTAGSRKPAAKSPAKPGAKRKAKAAIKPAVKKGAAVRSGAPGRTAAKPPVDARLTAIVVGALEDLKAVDIKVLDVRELTVITDAMVIATGTSDRHVKSLAQNVIDEAKQQGFRPLGVEGLAEGEWVLVNLNGILVHVMQVQTRAFYQLEKLWDMTQSESYRSMV